jgi:very-short-patch-repair endonuclease
VKFDVAVHVPLKMILCDTKKLDEDEKCYAENILTHVDFLIFDKLGKTPRLIIEVDGTSYHKEGTRQAERDKLKNRILDKYELPFTRVKTDGSNEREQLVSKLNEVVGL